MKRFLISLGVAACGLQLANAAEIQVVTSDAFQEKLEDEYGVGELEVLVDSINRHLENEFEDQGKDAARVVVTILDAKPNRPTFEQASDRPSLDRFRSISIGGADLRGEVYDAEGTLMLEYEYDYYTPDIRNVLGSAVWTDAKRASRRFADNLVDRIGN